jgi:hypothetical protein
MAEGYVDARHGPTRKGTAMHVVIFCFENPAVFVAKTVVQYQSSM